VDEAEEFSVKYKCFGL